jgi:hypothetical protein
LLDLNFQGQVAQLVERSPEKAGVGGSIPSLATKLSYLKSAFADLFLRLCQICAMNHPSYPVLMGLVFGGPFRIVPADGSGAVRKDVSGILDGPASP